MGTASPVESLAAGLAADQGTSQQSRVGPCSRLSSHPGKLDKMLGGVQTWTEFPRSWESEAPGPWQAGSLPAF